MTMHDNTIKAIKKIIVDESFEDLTLIVKWILEELKDRHEMMNYFD